MAKPKIDFRADRDAQLAQRAQNVFSKLTENDTVFPNPVPALPVVATGIDEFRQSMVDASLRNRQTVIVKNQKRKALETTLRELALYVAQVAKGDPASILAAGYEPSKTGTPYGPNPKPTGFRVIVNPFAPGRVTLRVNRLKGRALVNRFEYRKVGAEVWVDRLCSASTLTLDGLESLQRYEFRVAYVGTNPTLTYSDVVESAVL